MISVISDEVKADAGRARDRSRQDSRQPERRRPERLRAAAAGREARDPRRARVRRPTTPVIGFTGTFGGWHGVDVLAGAIPTICERAPRAQFLLIGDGNYKHLVDQEVARARAAASRAARRPRAAGRGRTAAEGVRHLRLAAQQPHGRQQLLRLADEDLRVHGDGRRHRRQRSRADRRESCRRRCPAADPTDRSVP